MNGTIDWIKAAAAISLVAGAAWVGLAGGAPTQESAAVVANSEPQTGIELAQVEI